jgi:hypothetical protein
MPPANPTTFVPSPLMVRAWFDTVLTPLIHGLGMELGAMKMGNLTWRYRDCRLVSLVPVKSHLVADAWPNWEQLLELHPELVPPVEAHDRALEQLAAEVRKYFAAVVNNPTLLQLLSESIESAMPSTEIFGAIPPEEYPCVVAEYIVNTIHRLPSYYSTAAFWNTHQEEFFALRELSDIGPSWRATEEAAKSFEAILDDLLTTLRRFRNTLSLDANVPIFESLAG